MKFGDPETIYAEVIADSITGYGHRLTTMEIQCHRYVLAEFNTHRVFSRNSASSRAIPVEKMLKRVLDHPAIPLEFPAEQKGMQGGEDLGPYIDRAAREAWRVAAAEAAHRANDLANLGVHKSVTNRLLEPFLYHRIIVSSTEWENFFAQRCSPLAQPEIRKVAEHMREALHDSQPRQLNTSGLWHMPYVTNEDWEEVRKAEVIGLGLDMHPIMVQISAARCARVSYMTHEGKRDLGADLKLFERLVKADPPHWSPLEHVARPQDDNEVGVPSNFVGWVQLRHQPDFATL